MKKKFGMTTGLLMIVVLLVSMAIGTTYAKYVTQKTLEENTVTITADIGTIVLQESKANRQPSGAYTLDTANPVAENSYVLIPGLDIPKDPHVVITKPDALPVYVYVEVVDGLGANPGVTYGMSKWTKLAGVTGPNGGTVYYYNSEIKDSQLISILDDNKVSVSQYLNKSISNYKLTFYAYMYQTAAGSDAAEVYKAYHKS